jgi:hypothetical protein
VQARAISFQLTCGSASDDDRPGKCTRWDDYGRLMSRSLTDCGAGWSRYTPVSRPQTNNPSQLKNFVNSILLQFR